MGDSPPLSPLPGHSVSSLNNQLLAHGFAKRPLRLDALPDAEQVAVTGVIVELLGANVSNLNRLEDLSARHRSLQFEWERLTDKVERQAKAVARLEHDVELGKARAAEAERRAQCEEREAQKLRHEMERGKKALETLRTAAAQEAKRAHLKMDKLTAAPRHALPHFELLNPIAAGTMAPAAPGPLPLLEAGIRDLDALRASKAEEAEAFRHVVVGAANGLREALAWSEGREAERVLLAEFFETDARHGQAASWTAHPSIADIKLRRLLDDVRERLAAGPPAAAAADGGVGADPEDAARERERARHEADLRDRVKDLEVEVSIARAKEAEAARVVDELARANAAAAVPSTTDFEDQRLRDELVRQKRLLDAERDELTRTHVRVAEERLSLEQAQRDFAARRDAEVELALRERECAERAERAERAGHAERDDEAKRKAEDSEEDSPGPGPGHEHQPARPSPLSPHRKRHVKKRPRPSLQRLVVEKQHHARAVTSALPPPQALPVPPAPPAPPARTPPAERVLSEGGERANAAGPSGGASTGPGGGSADVPGDTPMLGGARLLKAGVTLRKASGAAGAGADRPRKKAPAKPPVSAGSKGARRTPDTARKPGTLEAAGIRRASTRSSAGSAGSRASAGSAGSASSASSAGPGAGAAGATPSQRRLLAGTAASNAKAKRVEPDRQRLGNVWK